MKRMDLGGKWLLYYAPETAWIKGGMAFPEDAPCIEAQVPGNVELDLYRAGLEPDPFFGTNLYLYRKYEFYMWRYVRRFAVPAGFAPEEAVLRFGGINTYAKVYLNGCQVGEADNSLTEWEFEVSEHLKRGEENKLEVVIRSAANRAREEDYPVSVSGCEGNDEYVWQRKPAHSFGWDIMPRFPSAGLWRGVALEERSRKRITQAYYATVDVTSEGTAVLSCKWRFTTDEGLLEGYVMKLSGKCVTEESNGEGTRFFAEKQVLFPAGEFVIRIPSVRLWYPKGYGRADLYEAKLELYKDGVCIDTRTETIGLRKAELIHRMLPGDEGEFRIRVNGKDIFAKGSNWVPLDAFHSRDPERLAKAHELLRDAGCNIVRCWGGNVYEDHAFFDLCDRAGIMVWQDFSMACAVYPQEERFYRMIGNEAVSVVRKLRNHPSILLWAGDNEVDEGLTAKGWADTNVYNAVTREVLPEVVRREDPFRTYLPSSPYIDNGIARYDVPEQHNWGARAWYKSEFYKDTKAHFISECGYHGCPAPASLARFLSADKLWPMGNDEWLAHNTEYALSPRHYDRNKLMSDQVDILFGSGERTLEEFSFLSQVSQAEAKKFFIERARIKKWRRTGIIWWNLLDGWPQISDAVVDYYYTKKRAYDVIRRSMRDVCMAMDELSDWNRDVWLLNDGIFEGEVTWRVYDGDTGETLSEGTSALKPNENTKAATMRVDPGEKRLYLMEYSYNGETFGNHYLAGFPTFDAAKIHEWAEKIDRLK
ncbi:MAG: glycoside hydrolase family 2 [Clostridia bacterium]|nr:glycoside hydrolase family 2 [Clostridia bacterium]